VGGHLQKVLENGVNGAARTSGKSDRKIDYTYCKICRNELEVIEFKGHCICEECVSYIKENM